MTIGFDAKSIVCNITGFGNYGRTLVGDMAEAVPAGTVLNLYSPVRGDEALRRQLTLRPCMRFVYHNHSSLIPEYSDCSIILHRKKRLYVSHYCSFSVCK